MTINVTLSPLTPPAPGQAILNVRGWEESSSALEFAIQRGRDEFYLQQSEQWGNNPYWFKIDRFHEIDGNLQLMVGKDVVDPLLSASSDGALQFKLRLQDGSAEEEQTMRLKDGLLTSLAGAEQGGYKSSESGGHLQQPVAPAPISIPEPEPPKVTLPDIPAAPLTPVVTSPPPSPPKNNILLWLIPLILLLLLALGAGGWFFLNKGKGVSPIIDSASSAPAALGSTPPSSFPQTDSTSTSTNVTSTESASTEPAAIEAVPAKTTSAETTPAEPASTEAASPDTTPAESTRAEPAPTEPASAESAQDAGAPCSAENMAKLTELMFVQGCVKSVPSSAEMLKTINAAKDSKKCGIAQRLYAHRGQAGDIKIATAYAHEYDPKFHQPSECFKAPDAATAAYWYETILGLEPENAEAKQRFEELKP